jgi:hypothetical protein
MLKVLLKANTANNVINKLRKITDIVIPDIDNTITTCNTVKRVVEYLRISKTKEILTERIKACVDARQLLDAIVNIQNVVVIARQVDVNSVSYKILYQRQKESDKVLIKLKAEIKDLERKLGICPLCGKSFLN